MFFGGSGAGHQQGLDLVEGSEGMWEVRLMFPAPMFFPRILDQLADVKP